PGPSPVLHHTIPTPGSNESPLPAVITADVDRIESQLFLRQLQRVGNLLSDTVGHFAAGPELGRAVRRRIDDARMRLDVGMVHHRSGKGIFDNHVRLAKAGFDVSPSPGDIDNIVAGVLQRLW